MEVALAAVALVALICSVFMLVVNLRLMKQNEQLAKLLASRNITEYSLAEARLSKDGIERKPTDGYEGAWDSEET